MSGRVVISFVLGAYQNGIFSVASKFSAAFISAYNVFNLSWSESVSLHNRDKDADAYFSKVVERSFGLFSIAVAAILLLIPFAFPMLVDASYNAAYYQVPILLIGALAQVYVGLLSALYIGMKSTKEIAKTSAYAAIINVVLMLVLIRPMGMYGVSIASVVAFLSMAIYRTCDVRRKIDFTVSHKRMLLYFLLVGIAAISYYCFNPIMSLVLLLVLLAITAFLYMPLLKSVFKSLKK